jgi:poly(3-hydroxyalkanoate) synthetase
VRCPAFLLAGETDDITTREQVFGAQQYLGTPAAQVTSRLVPGGHIGLFMARAR